MKFIHEVEAIQYNNKNHKEISEFTNQKLKPFPCTLYLNNVTKLMINCPVRHIPADVYADDNGYGDWIIKHPDGSLTSMTDKKFKEYYKAV